MTISQSLARRTALGLGVLILILIATLSMGCDKSLKQRVDEAKGTSTEQDTRASQKAVEDAQLDYLDEWQAFKSSADQQLAADEKSVQQLTARGTTAAPAMANLRRTTDALKQRLHDYRDEGKVGWDAFKRDFSSDLDGLGKALRAEEQRP
jgi:hypothetical protein